MTTRLLTTIEAAAELNLGVSTLEKLRVYGGGPQFIKLGRAVRYRSDDLERWVEAAASTSTSHMISKSCTGGLK